MSYVETDIKATIMTTWLKRNLEIAYEICQNGIIAVNSKTTYYLKG